MLSFLVGVLSWFGIIWLFERNEREFRWQTALSGSSRIAPALTTAAVPVYFTDLIRGSNRVL
jgi:hypothetical protein